MEITPIWDSIVAQRNQPLKLHIVTDEEREERARLYSLGRAKCEHPKKYIESVSGFRVCRLCGTMVHDPDLEED